PASHSSIALMACLARKAPLEPFAGAAGRRAVFHVNHQNARPTGPAKLCPEEETKMLDKPQFLTPDYAPDRWRNIARNYTQADVARLSGSLPIRHTLAENGARRL